MTAPRSLAAVAVAALAVLAACSQPSTPDSDSGDGMFTNPVYEANFPDPGVMKVGDTYYAYGTNGKNQNVPLLTSKNLTDWTEAGDALPHLGSWARGGMTWAPEAIRTKSDGYALYYTARDTEHDVQCVGAAFSDSAEGPFTDPSDKPLVCQADEGGAIDASPFLTDDGEVYLYWKNDGNAIEKPTHIYGQRMTKDGRKFRGEPTRLLTNTAKWHKHVIEAPQLYQRDGKLYMFYSAGAFDADEYSVGYAVCDGPLGPCHDAEENPILTSSGHAAGPGHCSVVTGPDGKSTWMLYHAWPPASIGSEEPGRLMWLDEVKWQDGKPLVKGPTHRQQRAP